MRIHYLLAGITSLLFGVTAFAGNRLNLPQVSADLAVNGEALAAILGVQGDNQVLGSQLAQGVLGVLPADFRNGCHEMVPDFGPAAARQTTWSWSVRLLHVENRGGQPSGLLALRCTVHVPEVTFYDERLAVFASGQGTHLKLIPLNEDCPNCTDTYHLEFLQRFEAERGYLAELSVAHTTENPCCDGGDTDSGDQWVLIRMPSGSNVLTFNKDDYHYNHDDENGDTESRCESAVSYEHDAAPKLKAVVTTTSCTENGKSKPPTTTSRYIWSETQGRFEKRP